MPRPLIRPARGVSLAELLVGMVIALMVLGIALQLTLVARERYLRLADAALIEDRGMQALELIGRAVRQAGWITDTPALSSTRRWPNASAPPSLVGADDCGGPKMEPGSTLACSDRHGIQGSDALLVRFAGRSKSASDGAGDSAMLDCASLAVSERDGGNEDPRLGGMLLYVSLSTTNKAERVPQLMCKSFVRNTNAPVAARTGYGMVRGVETLQLLYTLAPTATAPAETLPARMMKDDDWYRVRQVHAAVVVLGDRWSPRIPPSIKTALFPGLDAPRAQAQDLELTPQDARRNRARFTVTLAVRNPLHCEADAC